MSILTLDIDADAYVDVACPGCIAETRRRQRRIVSRRQSGQPSTKYRMLGTLLRKVLVWFIGKNQPTNHKSSLDP